MQASETQASNAGCFSALPGLLSRRDLPPRRLWQPRRPGAADAAPGRQPRSPWPVAAGTRHWEWDLSHVDRVAGAVAARGDAVIESG
ncbi:unnamed protein product [Prorocentrum cordatum]|uniref:Uncharacterized protein n=1 Tax=Prorocentrum cordatum TaxID=2364126 RepID=A0ABN9X4W6_9DINO|nr:unnamed protein product [Polarella glacialis]